MTIYGADVGGAEVDAPKWDARTRSRASGPKPKPVGVHVRSVLLPDDCYLHETLSCNKGFELTYFYAWLIGLDQLCLICGTLSTFAVKRKIDRVIHVIG